MGDHNAKIVLEERISTVVGGRVVEGFRRVVQASRTHLHQEVVYLGFYLGDAMAYLPSEQVKMLDGAKRLLWEIASGRLHRRD